MSSPDTPLLVGIDVGTTSIKAVVYEPDGRAVSQASTPTVTHYPRPHWAFYRADELWQLTIQVLWNAMASIDRPERIVSVAVTSMGEAGVPLDADGIPTSDVIAWFDTRTQAEVEWLDRMIGKDALFRITGLSLQPIFGLCKLLWLKEHQPEAFSRTVRWLNIADYIAFRLSGIAATDYSLASRTLALDLANLRWDEQILLESGVPANLFAPLTNSGTALGRVTNKAAIETNLPTSAIVAVGGHDHVCGALATGVIQPGSMLNSLGTAEAVFLALDHPITDPAMGRQGYTQGAHVVPGHYYAFGGQYTSGASIAWVRDLVRSGSDYSVLIEGARAIPAGSLGACFLPHLRLANPPHDDPKARGAFVGLTADVTTNCLVRAVLEGLAFETRNSLEGLVSFDGVVPPQDIIAIGGGTRNALLLEIKATVLNQPIRIAHTEEATTHGAAILGGIASGVYQDFPSAIDTIKSIESTVSPVREWAPVYNLVFGEVYKPLYQALRPLNHAIYRIQTDSNDA